MITKEIRKELYAPQTSTLFLDLVDIHLPDDTHVRLVGDYTAVVSGGEIYEPAGFTVSQPNRKDVGGTANLNLAGLTTEHFKLIQSAVGDIYITISCISSIDLDLVVINPTKYKVKDIAINTSTGVASLTLNVSGVVDYQASSRFFDVSNFPGLVG